MLEGDCLVKEASCEIVTPGFSEHIASSNLKVVLMLLIISPEFNIFE